MQTVPTDCQPVTMKHSMTHCLPGQRFAMRSAVDPNSANSPVRFAVMRWMPVALPQTGWSVLHFAPPVETRTVTGLTMIDLIGNWPVTASLNPLKPMMTTNFQTMWQSASSAWTATIPGSETPTETTAPTLTPMNSSSIPTATDSAIPTRSGSRSRSGIATETGFVTAMLTA